MRGPSRVALLLLALMATVSAAEHGGGGREVRISELPDGHFKNELSNLPPQVQAKAMAWLAGHRFHDRDCAALHADSEGGILFACDALAGATTTPVASAATPVGAGSAPVANQPSYHSRPGATNRIFLDFNGATLPGTRWNASPAP